MRNATSAILAVLLAAAPAVAQAQSTGDAEAGRRVFNQCRACHIIDNNGRNAVGPNLYGIVGRRAASIANYNYSENMRELGQAGHVWTVENLRAYITNPKAIVPRGKMSFPGLHNQAQLNDLLAFLQTQHQ